MIKEFQGKFRWLSNFSPVRIEFEGRIFPSVEHAYMSAKSNSVEWKTQCSDPTNKPGFIKKQSKNVELVPNWNRIRVETMEILLKKKFEQEPWKSWLLSTGHQELQEGNWWGDEFWGVNLKTGNGQNVLGKLIMKIREQIRKETE